MNIKSLDVVTVKMGGSTFIYLTTLLSSQLGFRADTLFTVIRSGDPVH